MRLYFSTDHVRNSTITNSSGQVLYKVNTPFRPFFMTGTTTIRKIVPNHPPIFAHPSLPDSGSQPNTDDEPDHHDDPDGVPPGEENEIYLRDQFAELAQIEFRRLTSSTLRWFGLNSLGSGVVKTSEYIPYMGINRNWRHFTGPDDRKYKWHLGVTICELYLEGGPRTPIARYHRYKSGLLGRPRCGYLEIAFPRPTEPANKPSDDTVDLANYTDYELEASLHRELSPKLLDTILVTFIYVEKLRREREQAAKRNILQWNY
ncbi:hypothetical protein BU15DRAFT_40419 [Melanogaster broomeanus]|nr:hypothetical protein BU15DRAFT_40419 [Melanogaster broomeanus]